MPRWLRAGPGDRLSFVDCPSLRVVPGTGGQTLGFYGNGFEQFTIDFPTNTKQANPANTDAIFLNYDSPSLQDQLSFTYVSGSPVLDYSDTNGTNAPVTGRSVSVTAASPITFPFTAGDQIKLSWTFS